jgi:hypothetical protein
LLVSTFVRTLNYGNATIKAEPIIANRTSTITLVDLRTEKAFGVGRTRVVGFLDVYNAFNTNADDQFGRPVAAANGDHRATRAPDDQRRLHG